MNPFALVLLLLGFYAQAQPPGTEAQPPDSPQTRLATDYFRAFNAAGDDQMRSFLEKYVTKQGLERTPVEVRLARFAQIKERLGKLEVARMTITSPTSVVANVQSAGGGLVEFTFDLEGTDPPKLRGIRVEDLGQGEAAVQTGPPKANERELIAAVESHFRKAAADGEFSGAILIARGDKVLFEEAYGFANRESQTPNRTDTRFNLGSINKIFTNIAIHQLIRQGKLSLDDPISKILPDYPNKEAAAKVKIEHLLSMRSGIGDFFGERFQKAPKEKIQTISDYLPLFADLPLEFEPGSRARYSNGGYVVLGAIIEKVSGTDYYSYVKRNIYLSAGMKDSDWFDKSKLPANTAIGYTREGPTGEVAKGDRVANYETLPGRGSSAGGGYSNLRDLFAFVQAMKQGKVTTPDFQPDGLGIAGGAPGINAVVETDPRYTVVVLSNFDPPTAEKAGRLIRGWLPR